MMEQLDVSAAAMASSVSLRRALSDEARASLEAIRVAREATRQRARQQTVRARIWLAAVIAGVGLTAVAVGPRIVRGRHARALAAKAAAPSPVAPVRPAAPAVGSTVSQTLAGAASVASVRTPESADRSPTELPPVAAPGKAAAVVGAEEGCDAGLIRRAPWRLSAQACARAFEADPSNAMLALAIAHAEHAHGSVSEAAQWAKRALALDPNVAEAHLLIARADVAGGLREEAAMAYRRYLELAPRGWHKAEARAAVEAARTTAPVGSAGIR